VRTKKRQIGLRVRAYRLERRLTQEQLAEMIERSVETISNLERGTSLPNEATLRRLAKSLDVPFEDLLIDRSSGASGRSIEFFQATELLKMMDEKKLKLAYNILKIIADA
jgi:transcriptional regulator with XRE-family HTH domain